MFRIIGAQIPVPVLPVASVAGRIAIDDATGNIYRDSGNSGTGWVLLSGGGGGGGIPATILDAKGDLVTATAADTPARLPVGADGQIIVADSTQATGLRWSAAPGGGISPTLIDAKGDLIAGSAPDVPARLPVGADGQILEAHSPSPLGVRWTAAPGAGGIPSTIMDAKGDLIGATANDAPARVAVGADGTVLTADSAQPTGIRWATPTGGIAPTIFNAKGDILGASANDTPAITPVGADGQVLTASAASPTGLTWTAAPSGGIPASVVDAKGDLIGATANDTPARVPVGADLTMLIADTGQATGVRWGTPAAANVSNAPAGGIAAVTVQAAINELDTEKQPIDADLTAIAGLATTGLVARTGAGTAASRSVAVGGTAGLGVTNGDGVAGNPTVTLAATNDSNGKLAVSKNSGATVGTRRRLNLIEGSNVTLTVADDAGNEEVDVTIAAAGGGGGSNPLLASLIAQSTLISNTTAESTYDKSYTLPAGALNTQGTLLRITALGRYNCNATGGFTIRTKLAGVTIGSFDTGVFTVPIGTNMRWVQVTHVITRTTGASGGIVYAGGWGGDSPVDMRPSMLTSTPPATVNLTGTLAITVTAQWTVADAFNSSMMDALLIEVLTPTNLIS